MNTELTEEELSELEELRSMATQGPWRVGNWIEEDKLHLIYSQPQGHLEHLIARTCFAPQSHQNATLISEMQEKLPALISMARRAKSAEERLERAETLLLRAVGLLDFAGRETEKTWEPGQSWIFVDDKKLAKSLLGSLREFLESPKGLHPPQPCAPPAHSDVQP